MYPRVPGQLVGSREALRAAGKLADVRLLARVRPDVTGLVLETVEGLVAERALVRARQVGTFLSSMLLAAANHGRHHADGSHLGLLLLLGQESQLLAGLLLLLLDSGLGIQQIFKIYCRRSALHQTAAAAFGGLARVYGSGALRGVGFRGASWVHASWFR